MPFPATLAAMFSSGYDYARWEHCAVCGEPVEIYTTPGKREIAMEPMCSRESLAVRHYLVCKPPNPTPEAQKPQEQAVAPQQIKLYGVTDKNMIACGWQDGTLAIQFRYGLYHYANVPENVFVTLRRNPYPNNYFTKVVKNHPELYPCTKVG